jgi:hypothetical protein
MMVLQDIYDLLDIQNPPVIDILFKICWYIEQQDSKIEELEQKLQYQLIDLERKIDKLEDKIWENG